MPVSIFFFFLILLRNLKKLRGDIKHFFTLTIANQWYINLPQIYSATDACTECCAHHRQSCSYFFLSSVSKDTFITFIIFRGMAWQCGCVDATPTRTPSDDAEGFHVPPQCKQIHVDMRRPKQQHNIGGAYSTTFAQEPHQCSPYTVHAAHKQGYNSWSGVYVHVCVFVYAYVGAEAEQVMGIESISKTRTQNSLAFSMN